MQKSAEILEKRHDQRDSAKAELLVSWWRAKTIQENEQSTAQILPEILEYLGSIIQVLPNVIEVEDPDLPDHEIVNSEIASRMKEWLRSFLPDTISRENYTGMSTVYNFLAGIGRISGSAEASLKELEANRCLCELIMSEGSDDTSSGLMELRAKLVGIESLEWPYGSEEQVSSGRLLQEVSCLELEIGFSESNDVEVLGKLVESTKKLEESESFVLLDRVLRRSTIETQKVHLSNPSDRSAYLEGLLELKKGRTISKEAPSEAEKHYIVAEKLFQECNDPNWEDVHRLRLEIVQSAVCSVCHKEKTGLRVNYDLVKIDLNRPESALFRDIASVLGELPDKNATLFPLCRDCQDIIEATVRQKSIEMRDTVIDSIRKQAEDSRRSIEDAKDQAVVSIETYLSKIRQQEEALSTFCREEEQQLGEVGQRWIEEIRATGANYLGRLEDRSEIHEASIQQHEEKLKRLESDMTAAKAALGVGGIVGIFSGQSLKDRVESLEQEINSLRQHAGLG